MCEDAECSAGCYFALFGLWSLIKKEDAWAKPCSAGRVYANDPIVDCGILRSAGLRQLRPAVAQLPRTCVCFDMPMSEAAAVGAYETAWEIDPARAGLATIKACLFKRGGELQRCHECMLQAQVQVSGFAISRSRLHRQACSGSAPANYRTKQEKHLCCTVRACTPNSQDIFRRNALRIRSSLGTLFSGLLHGMLYVHETPPCFLAGRRSLCMLVGTCEEQRCHRESKSMASKLHQHGGGTTLGQAPIHDSLGSVSINHCCRPSGFWNPSLGLALTV